MIHCGLGLQAKFQRSGGTDCDFYILAVINPGKVPICAIKRLIIPGKCHVVGQDVLYFGFHKGTLGRHVVNSYLSMKGGFIHTNFSPPYPLNCLDLNQQFFLKSVRSHLFFLFLPVLCRHVHSFLNWPFFKFSTYRHVLFSHRRRKCRGQRKMLCSVRLPDDTTRTRGTCVVF